MTEAAVIVLLVCIIISGVTGVIFNGGLIILTVIRAELRVDYCWFLIGMSANNVLYCFNLTVIQTITILLDIEAHSMTCQIAGFLLVMCCAGSVLTQPILALNRYSVMFYREGHSKRFCKRNIFLMLAGIYTLAFLIALSYIFFDDYAKFNNLCCFDMVNMNIVHLLVFFMTPVGVAYGVSIFCGVSITRFLKLHEAQTKRQDFRSNIRETQQIIKFIFLEICIPVVLESPILTMTIIMRFVPVPDVLVSVACGLFIIHASTDPIIIIMIVKPYRTAARKVWHKLRNKTDVNPVLFTTQQSTVMTTMS